ncbi:MAG: hypothetical protein P4M01_05320 [Acidobacteriota bacterium]|nr:hypothetical protein [Acidobacteriota bacterium]
MKKTLDALCAWALFVLAAAYFVAVYLHQLPMFIALWSPAAAVAVMDVALMNAVRSQRRNDRFLRWASICATAITASLCLRWLYDFPGNVLHQPVVLGTCLLLVIEVIFAVAG